MDDLFQLSRHFLQIHNRPYRRYILSRAPFSARFSLLVGHRGVGKTTALVQFLLDSYGGNALTTKALYVPVDHFVVGERSLYEVAEEFHQLGGELLCLDEIHKYGHWSGELKSIYDSFPSLKVIASGSSALEVGRGSHDLSRRAIVQRMHGLSLREYVDLQLAEKTEPFALDEILSDHERIAADLVDRVEATGHKILPLFNSYLRRGYYPYFREFDDEAHYYIAIEQSLHATIESDLLAIHPSLTGSSIKKIKKLLAVIAESVPFTPDMKRLKKLIDVGDERTLKMYLQYLQDGGAIIALPGVGRGVRGMEKPEKIYLHNPNQVHAISAVGRGNIGNLRETFFVNMVSVDCGVVAAKSGDFVVDGRYTIEVGGKGKDFRQLRGVDDAFLAVDGIERGIGHKVPLWLFGYVY